jgi:Adenylate cyclase, class 2 (thermophilic)
LKACPRFRAFSYGQIGRVRKHRALYLIGRTRVHFDKVEDLGDFLELEVVLAEGESAQSGVDVARELMVKFGVEPSQLIEDSYLDLVLANRARPMGLSAECDELQGHV